MARRKCEYLEQTALPLKVRASAAAAESVFVEVVSMEDVGVAGGTGNGGEKREKSEKAEVVMSESTGASKGVFTYWCQI